MTQRPPMIHTRLPPSLKEEIEQAAKESGRSVNAEVVWRLEESFSKGDEKPEASSSAELLSLLLRSGEGGAKALRDLLQILELLGIDRNKL